MNKDEPLPHCINYSKKDALEALEAFLVELAKNDGVLLGHIMKSLHGHINPAEAMQIIKERLHLK